MRIGRNAIGGFLLGVVTVACVDRLPDQDLRILTAPPLVKLSADLLWQEFQERPDEAGRKYFRQVVEITGIATRVGDDVPTGRYVLFAQAGDAGVRANLLDEQAAGILARVREDPRVTLRCFCEGMDGHLVLRSCIEP